MTVTISGYSVRDIRTPTSRTLAGSDAVHTDPDYSAAYVVLHTDAPNGVSGHGITFTLGRGTEVCVAAVKALAPLIVGRTLESLTGDMASCWRLLTNESQLRWIGPEKGAIHLATAAIVNAIWDLATHDLAILRFLLAADPLAAEAYGAAFHDPATAEVAYVQLRYPGNVLANLHVSWLDPVKVRRMTVVGSQRMAVWDDVEPVEKLRVFDRGMEHRPYHDDFGQWQVAYRYGESAVVPIQFQEPLRLQAEEFLRAIRSRDTPLSSGADGLAVVRTLEQATATMRLMAHERNRP